MVSRRQTQVSKDFDLTLKTVVRISSYFENEPIGSNQFFPQNICQIDNNDKKSSLKARRSFETKENHVLSKLSRSSTLNVAKTNWKSVNSVVNEDLKDLSITESSDLLTKIDNIAEEMLEKKYCKIISEAGISDSIQENDLSKENFPNTLKRNNSKLNDKKSKKIFLKNNLFSTFRDPFEGTDITNLSFCLPIIIENRDNLLLTVFNHYTIDKIKLKIAKKTSYLLSEIGIFYAKKRLEGHITLSWYNINSKSKVFLQRLHPIEVTGRYQKINYPISMYTSEKINEMKCKFSKKIEIDCQCFELKYREIFLEENKEVFMYDIGKGSIVDIIPQKLSTSDESPDNILYSKSPGFVISQHFQSITAKLKKCNCEDRRYNAMACALLSTCDADFKDHKCLSLLKEFSSNFHHISCSKAKTSDVSTNNEIEIEPDSVNSVGEKSLNESLCKEIEKIENNKNIIIENADLEYLCNSKNFKAFKHFMRDRIGTKCNLRTISILYHFAQKLVRFIDPKNENDPTVKRMLNYISLYFLKYFEKPIIAKGGLVELTLNQVNNED